MKILALAVLLSLPLTAQAANTYNKILTDGTPDNILIGGRKQIIGYAPVILSSSASGMSLPLSADILCISTLTITQFGGRPFQAIARVQFETTAAVTVTSYLYANDSLVGSSVHDVIVNSEETFTSIYFLDSSVAGETQYEWCLSATDAPVVKAYSWRVRED